MFDLLDNIGESDHLKIVDDNVGGVKVKGLTMVQVADEHEVLNHFFNGENNRAVAQHSLNEESSRSHAIFTLHIEARSRIESAEKITLSKLNLVDLAGSERVKKTDTEGAGLEEAKFINRSLTYLEQCVVAASDKNRDHIPFRQTRLTNILRDSIGGNCATLLIATIWAEKQHLDETLSTCRFAQRMMRVQNTPSAKIHADPALLLKKYEKEIRQLKQELTMHDTLAGRTRVAGKPVTYDEYDDEARMALKSEVEEYLEGKQEDIELVNLRHMREILGVTRHIFREMKVKEPFQRHFNAISTPFQRHFNAISTPILPPSYPHFNPISGQSGRRPQEAIRSQSQNNRSRGHREPEARRGNGWGRGDGRRWFCCWEGTGRLGAASFTDDWESQDGLGGGGRGWGAGVGGDHANRQPSSSY